MYKILKGKCEEVLLNSKENLFHSCITDPPYGMGMDHWDHSVPDVTIWKEVYRVLRPGAFCLAFCSPELYHRLACNVEDAGFKNTSPKKVIDIVKWGCGLIDIENTRVPWDKEPPKGWIKGGSKRRVFGGIQNKACDIDTREEFWVDPTTNERIINEKIDANTKGRYPSNIIGEVQPSEQKYFYAPRATRKEKGVNNDHPTVKPISLMSYLIEIYCPEKGIVLDPFCGSGTTGVASLQKNRNFVGIDMIEKYIEISKERCSNI